MKLHRRLNVLVVIACLSAFAISPSSAGVMDKIKDTMNDYHLVNITIPAQYMPKRLWQTLMSTRFTIHVPQIPLVSGLLRRSNVTTSEESSKPSSSSSVSSAAAPTPVSPNKLNGFTSDTSNWCGGNVLLDLNSRKEVTYKSTNFPGPRSNPYACSWDVKVAKNCKRGVVTLTLDQRSRLPENEKCTKGYFRVSPFMKEAKLCGPIGSAPAFQWHVDQDSRQPNEEVSIIMKSIGLNDGHAEGVAFSIKGECLQKETNRTTDEGPDGTLVKNLELSTQWMTDILAQSSVPTDSRKKGKLGVIRLYAANMSLAPVSKLSSSAAADEATDKVSVVEHFSAHSSAPHAVLEPILDAGDDPGLKPNNVVLYSPLFLLFKRFGWLVK